MEDDKGFAKNLKAIRIAANISISEISNYLVSLGYKASEKTIYSWESGNSQPSPSALLDLCSFCGVNDVLASFGYTSVKGDTAEAEKHLLKNYKLLNTEGQEKLIEYSDDLVDTGKYKKHNEVKLGSKEA
ncbi:MAG: helix-turn-helix transcriptional regulator [Acutalibacter muris]|jgi:transcriptional regulator with XRE-family HTH domain|nr:helix-turn-helix transcriptional regulator [Acutalibacter muris]